jgi:hypothetical protein
MIQGGNTGFPVRYTDHVVLCLVSWLRGSMTVIRRTFHGNFMASIAGLLTSKNRKQFKNNGENYLIQQRILLLA